MSVVQVCHHYSNRNPIENMGMSHYPTWDSGIGGTCGIMVRLRLSMSLSHYPTWDSGIDVRSNGHNIVLYIYI